jgi:hypothetical protein
VVPTPSVPNTFVASTVAQSAKVNENFQTIADAITPTFTFTITGTLVTGTNLTPALIVPNDYTIQKAYAYVKTVPTGASIYVDINVNGTSIWSADQSNRVQIAAAAQTGSSTIFDDSSLAEGDIITIDVDQVGSTVSGADITIELKCN